MPKWFNGMSNFEALHSRANDARASACAFDLLMRDGEDLRKKPYSERKAMLLKTHKQVERAGGGPGVIGTAMQRLEIRHAVGIEPNHFGINNRRAFDLGGSAFIRGMSV